MKYMDPEELAHADEVWRDMKDADFLADHEDGAGVIVDYAEDYERWVCDTDGLWHPMHDTWAESNGEK